MKNEITDKSVKTGLQIEANNTGDKDKDIREMPQTDKPEIKQPDVKEMPKVEEPEVADPEIVEKPDEKIEEMPDEDVK